LQRLNAIDRGHHCMSTALMMVLGQHAHDGVIFDDEDVGHGALD
jgi:hypothetical protein